MARIPLWSLALLLTACGGGVDLTVEAPRFSSSSLVSGAANPFTVQYRVSGELPGDSEDLYVTVEFKKPGASSFSFDDNAQVQRAKVPLAEPVDYIFHVNDGPGSYAFRAIVDAGSLIDESDENNNVSPETQISTQ